MTIYLDSMATTPVEPDVARKMARYLTGDGDYGNPSAIHYPLGQSASAAVAAARAEVAALLGIAEHPESIVFTSGATEANNLALQGVAHAYCHKGMHIISVATEHSSVLDCLSALQKQGFSVSYLTPQKNGLVDLQQFRAAFRPDTILASVMWVNNEIGVIQDIAAMTEICRQRSVLFHVDAAQAAGKLAIDLSALSVDLLSLSAHKIYGPKGIGALYCRPQSRLHLQPLLYGGGQEGGVRSGTQATHQIVGFGAAAVIAKQKLAEEAQRLKVLQAYTFAWLDRLPGATVHGDRQRRIPHNVHFSLQGVTGNTLAQQLGAQGICVATGSACHSAHHQPSHVLRGLGCSVELAQSALRLSFGRETTQSELDQTFAAIEKFCRDSGDSSLRSG